MVQKDDTRRKLLLMEKAEREAAEAKEAAEREQLLKVSPLACLLVNFLACFLPRLAAFLLSHLITFSLARSLACSRARACGGLELPVLPCVLL